MIKIRYHFIIVYFFFFINVLPAQELLFYEDFSVGYMPSGWTQEYVHYDLDWNIREGAGNIGGGNIGVPDTAAVGDYNATFQKQSDKGEITKLITPLINLEFAVKPELRFWHAQLPMQGQDELKVYYREGSEGDWIEIAHYTASTGEDEWVERFLILETQSDSTYIAFEGINGWGMGVCIDGVTVIETDVVEKFLTDITTVQASTDRIPAGADNNKILRTGFRVYGNTGDFILEEYTINSLNSDDDDIKDEGVKLFLTSENVFHTSNQISSGVNFVDGVAEFTGLDVELPTGYSYVWVAFDVEHEAGNLNKADAYIPEDGILANDSLYPPKDHDPPGYRLIYSTVFHDDFDTDKGWQLSGEFERDEPLGLGGYDPEYPGSGGQPGASYAFTGTNVLGTDLTGLGDFPGNYEPDLGEKEYQAISPLIDCYYFNDIVLSFYRWVNIYISGYMDKATIEISTDNGGTWNEVWRNTFHDQIATIWSQQNLSLPELNREESVRIRFTLGPTGGYYNYSGWNIDNLFLSGSFITKDVGVTDWLYPEDGCGLTDEEEVAVVIKNFGAEASPDIIPVGFSLDGGENWHMDTLYQSLNVDESVVFIFEPKADFSQPGKYDNVIAKTFLEGDQDTSNDAFYTSVLSLPTYELPYAENFENDDGLWAAYGDNVSWEWAVPDGEVIENAQSGQYAWITDSQSHYNPYEVSWVESPCFDFTGNEFSVLEFWLNTDTHEDVDGVSLQYTLDESETWETLEPFDEELVWNWFVNENITSLENAFECGKGWDGQSEEWFRPRIVLPYEVLDYNDARFRFVFASGANTQHYEGVAFDNVQLYEAPHDVGVVELIEPESDCELSVNQTIKISIKNFGINPVEEDTEIPVGVDVNELSPVYESFVLNEPLHPEETVNYTFETTFDMSEIGDHSIVAYTMLPGDTDFYNPGVYNDTLSSIVTVYGYPEIDLGEDIYTTQPDTVVLDAGEGFEEYLWQDGSSDQYYYVSLPYTYEYSVTVWDIYGCSAFDDIMIIAHDLSVVEITSPVSDCELGENEQISVKIQNVGPDTISSGTEAPLSIHYESSYITTESLILQDDLHPSDYTIHTFEPFFDLTEETTHEFRIYHHYKDAFPANDTLDAVIEVFGYPKVDLGEDIYTLQPDTVVLDAGEGFEDYTWQDGSTGQYYYVESLYSQDYSVTVTDFNTCPGWDTVRVITYDIEVAELLEPEDACVLSNAEPVTVLLINHGPESFYSGDTFTFILNMNSSFISEDDLVVSGQWDAGEPKELTFSETVNMEDIGEYEFEIYMTEHDASPDNDTLNVVVEVTGYPEVDLGEDIYTMQPDTVVLDAGEGFATYLWCDGSTSQTLEISDYGTYSVTVTNDLGCEGDDSINVLPEIHDLAMTEIVAPVTLCEGAVDVFVVVEVTNEGNMTVPEETEIEMGYRFDDQDDVIETMIFQNDLMPGESLVYTYDNLIEQVGSGSWSLMAWLFYDKDENNDNDTIITEDNEYKLPDVYLGEDIYTTEPDTVVLDAGDGFAEYLWQDGSEERYYYVSSPYTQEYSVTVTDHFGCSNSDSIWVKTFDLALEELIEPQSSCTLGIEETFVFTAQNKGYDTFKKGDEFSFAYEINNDIYVEESFVLDNNLLPGNIYTFYSDETFDLSQTGDYEIKIYYTGKDANSLNDTIKETIIAAGLPEVDLGEDIYTTQPDTIVLDAGEGFEVYLWHDGSTHQLFDVYDFGIHWVVVNDIYGCQGSDTLNVINSTGVENIFPGGHNVYIYPNPAYEYLNVKFDILGEHKILVYISGITGNIIIKNEYEINEYDEYKIYVGDFDPGLYFISIIIDNQYKVLKFLKQ